jgi:hypothetical protein
MSFIRYAQDDSVVSSETVIRGLFSGDNNELSTLFTSSNAVNNNYLEVFDGPPSSISSSVQFTIQYANINGSGSALFNPLVNGSSITRVIYGQYRNLVYGTEDINFSFDGATTAEDIFIINYSRARYKESLLPGSVNIRLRNSSNNNQIFLTDDSNTSDTIKFIGENRYYNIISGSNGVPHNPNISSITYGYMFPDLNIVILKASGTNSISSFLNGGIILNNTGADQNTKRFFNSLVASTLAGHRMNARSAETVSSRYFFTRVKNAELNYTTNPSIIDENGNILNTSLINSPQTYITAVGLYNDNNELLAVAKLSKPLVKDFTKEALIRVKLDY